MSTTIIKTSNRAEWLKHREQGIGSSEIATIVGLNPWETPYQLWRRKIGLDPAKEVTFAMKAGHYLEDAVSMFWQDENRSCVVDKSSATDFLVVKKEKPFLRVSPDRFYQYLDNNEIGILECKTTQMKVDEDNVPKWWFCQLQYQLGVAEMNNGSLAWLVQGREFGCVSMQLVPSFYAWLEEEAERFWVDNILGKKEPLAINAQDVLAKYNLHTQGKTVDVGDDIYSAYSELKSIKNEMKELEERKATLEDKIKVNMKDAESAVYNGLVLATWKAPKPSKKFNAKAFQEDNPELSLKYTFEVQGSRRFLIK